MGERTMDYVRTPMFWVLPSAQFSYKYKQLGKWKEATIPIVFQSQLEKGLFRFSFFFSYG